MLSWQFRFLGILLASFAALNLIAVKVDAQYVNLFNTPHAYDFEVTHLNGAEADKAYSAKNYAQDLFNRRFEYFIMDEGKCATKTSTSLAKDLVTKFKDAQFVSKPLLYSNSWKTLSFLLRIDFEAKGSIESHASFYGYELKFQSYEKPADPTCIHILPYYDAANRPDDYGDRHITMNIKDPSFLSHKDKNYAFNLGKVSLNIMIGCAGQGGNSIYCTSDQLSTETPNYLGIPSDNSSIDTSLFRTKEYICEGTVVSQTCIMRYQPKNGENYIVVHQPMTSDISTIVGFDYFGQNNYLTNIAHQHQRFKNGLDIKLMKVDHRDLYYSSVVTQLTPGFDNQTLQICEKNKRLCYCDQNKCPKTLVKENGAETVYHNYCLLTKEDYQSKSKSYAAVQLVMSDVLSKQCIYNPFFHAFNYANVDLADEFQGRRLDFEPRKVESINVDNEDEQAQIDSIFYNREMLPRICLINKDFISAHSSLTDEQELTFDLVFVSKFKTAAPSSRFSRNFNYKLNFYSFEMHNCELSDRKSNIAKSIPMTPISLNLVLKKTVKLNETVELKSIKLNSNYILELIPISDSSLCNAPGECVDEGDRNNMVVCRPCNKLIVYMRTNKRIRDKKSFDFNSNDCSVDLREYQEALLSSFRNRENLGPFDFATLNVLEKTNPKNTQTKLLDIYSGVIPAHSSINELKLPVTYGVCIVRPHPNIYVYLCILLAITAIFIFCSFLLYNYAKTRTVLVGRVNERVVMFYVQARDRNNYEHLDNLAKSYKRALRNWFSQMRIEVVTDISQLRYSLKRYDLIVYTCADQEELNYVNAVDLNNRNWIDMLRIGQNAFDDDFNRFHFVRAYKNKCVDILNETRQIQDQTRLIVHGLVLGTKHISYRDNHFNYDLYFNRNAPRSPGPNLDTASRPIFFMSVFKEFSLIKLVKKVINQLNKMYLRFLLSRIQTAINRSVRSRIEGNREFTHEDDHDEDSDESELA